MSAEGKCPFCPAEYSTTVELQRHRESKWDHLRERYEKELGRALILETAIRVECAKFRFPEEDRPELAAALAQIAKLDEAAS
jgi:hypothetical protein